MWRWLWWATWEWFWISLALATAWRWPWTTPAALLIVARGQHALAVLGHEGTHFAVAGRTALNEHLTNGLCFWPLGVDSNAYRIFHIVHHAYLDTLSDPEVHERAKRRWAWTMLTRRKKALLIAGDLVGLGIPEAWSISKRLRGEYRWPRVVYVALIVAAALVVWPLLLLWFGALFTACWAMMRARMWREHVGIEPEDVGVPAWWRRLVYLPHYTWRHALHHQPGKWDVPAWDLTR